MLSLDAWTARDLRACLTLLDQARAAGLDLAGLRADLARRVPATPAAVHVVPPAAPPSAPHLCPSCGRGPLMPVANRDGLRIMGCRLCRYSEVR